MEFIKEYLAANPMMLIFIVIGVGFVLSTLKVKGVGFGVAFVLFAGIAMGAWGEGLFNAPELTHRMEMIGQIGLLLFVYTIGLQAGPAFFRILKKRGFTISLMGAVVVLLSAVVAAFCARWFGLGPEYITGIFCGALTNTPALAAATEYLHGAPTSTQLTVGYSVAYPLGVIIPILFSQLIARGKKIDIEKEVKQAEKQSGQADEPPVPLNIRVTNKDVFGKTIAEAMPPQTIVSRVLRGTALFIPGQDTVLQPGDVLHLVTNAEVSRQVTQLLGEEYTLPGPEQSRTNIDFRRIMITNSQLVGRSLSELNLEEHWGAVATRVRRGDTDFVPRPDTRLERGDRLRIVAPADKMNDISKWLGDQFKTIAETDYFSFAIGILAGLIIGSISIPLPGGVMLKLGLAGGPMLVGLILGHLGRTGNMYWSMPLNTNLTLRQFGLVLFFAVVGIKAGGGFMTALAGNGLWMLAAGALVTLFVSASIMWASMKLLKMDWVSATGTLGGTQTQPAILSYIGDLAHSEAPNAAYAAIMPAAMIIKIIAAQLLLFWLL